MTDSPNLPKTKRPYRGRVQAEVAALTRQRILDATLALAAKSWFDQMTLEQVASLAGVTVQTVIRHFGSKEQLIGAAGQYAHQLVARQRDEAPVGLLPGALRNLLDHYETDGHGVLRILAQEQRYPAALSPLLDAGRRAHRAWVERTFDPWLASHPPAVRERIVTQLAVITDVHTWDLLRRDHSCSRDETEDLLTSMICAVLPTAC